MSSSVSTTPFSAFSLEFLACNIELLLSAFSTTFFMRAFSTAISATCKSSLVARPSAISRSASARANLSAYSVLAVRDCFRLPETSESSCSIRDISSAWWSRSSEPRLSNASAQYIISMLPCSKLSEGTPGWALGSAPEGNLHPLANCKSTPNTDKGDMRTSIVRSGAGGGIGRLKSSVGG